MTRQPPPAPPRARPSPASLFKRVILGTHHSLHPIHLDRYLGEPIHRFNNHDMADASLLTMTAARVAGRRITDKELTSLAMS